MCWPVQDIIITNIIFPNNSQLIYPFNLLIINICTKIKFDLCCRVCFHDHKFHPISFGSRLLNAKKYVNPSAFKCRKRVHVRTLRYIGLAFNAEKVQITRKKKKLVFHWPLWLLKRVTCFQLLQSVHINSDYRDGQVKKSGGLGFDSSIVTHCRLDNSGLVTGINL